MRCRVGQALLLHLLKSSYPFVVCVDDGVQAQSRSSVELNRFKQAAPLSAPELEAARANLSHDYRFYASFNIARARAQLRIRRGVALACPSERLRIFGRFAAPPPIRPAAVSKSCHSTRRVTGITPTALEPRVGRETKGEAIDEIASFCDDARARPFDGARRGLPLRAKTFLETTLQSMSEPEK